MSGSIERFDGLDTSLGHGIVAATDFIESYVVVEPDSPLLPKESPVGRSEYGALVVSASLPTKPEKTLEGEDDTHVKPPTQSSEVRKFVKDERKAKGLEPPKRKTSLTYQEVRESMM